MLCVLPLCIAGCRVQDWGGGGRGSGAGQKGGRQGGAGQKAGEEESHEVPRAEVGQLRLEGTGGRGGLQ